VSSTLGRGSERDALLTGLTRELRRVSGQSVLFSHAVADRLGMHPTDLECLGFLAEEGPVPAGRLAELTGLTTGAVTRMIDRLERAGYVRREADPRDRRRVIVRALPERAREIAPLFEGMDRAMTGLCAGYSDEQLAVILDFINRAGALAQEENARLQTAGPDAGRAPGATPESPHDARAR
jgi:DNA-binding MarR family transcriptional regulator